MLRLGLLSASIVLLAGGAPAQTTGACRQGYVWREAFAGDHVCVTSQVRSQAADDNRQAASRLDPQRPGFCRQGYVWREASATDHVCVVPETRAQASRDNAAAATRLLPSPPTPINKASIAEQLQDLVDEPSRGELFQRLVNPAGKIIPFTLPLQTFTFPNDTTYSATREESIFGVDISHYTAPTIPLDRFSLDNIKFVYMKATQGAHYKDDKFAVFWNRLGNLPANQRVHRGAYHFLSSQDDVMGQANAFIGLIAEYGGLRPTDMPPVVDLEWDITSQDSYDRWQGQSPQAILQKLLSWLTLVETKTGRTPMIYTSAAWWKERIKDEAQFAALSRYMVWIADYSSSAKAVENPAVPNKAAWSLWQFTANARLASGYDQGLDASIFKGTAAGFYRIFQTVKF
jgi:lysozyme